MAAFTEMEPWRDLEIITPRAQRHYRDLPFHGFPHALETSGEVRVIAADYSEHGLPLSVDEIEDAEIGMLYHDAGFFVPLHQHHFKSKEAYARHLMASDQRELGMPGKRIQRIGGGIISTQLHVKPRTRVAKVMRQADLSNVAKQPPLQVVRNSIRLFREDEILKRDYGHPGVIKTDILSFIAGSYRVMCMYNEDDVSLGVRDRTPDGRSNFAVLLDKGMQCFLPDEARTLLRRLHVIPGEPEATDPAAS